MNKKVNSRQSGTDVQMCTSDDIEQTLRKGSTVDYRQSTR